MFSAAFIIVLLVLLVTVLFTTFCCTRVALTRFDCNLSFAALLGNASLHPGRFESTSASSTSSIDGLDRQEVEPAAFPFPLCVYEASLQWFVPLLYRCTSKREACSGL